MWRPGRPSLTPTLLEISDLQIRFASKFCNISFHLALKMRMPNGETTKSAELGHSESLPSINQIDLQRFWARSYHNHGHRRFASFVFWRHMAVLPRPRRTTTMAMEERLTLLLLGSKTTEAGGHPSFDAPLTRTAGVRKRMFKADVCNYIVGQQFRNCWLTGWVKHQG